MVSLLLVVASLLVAAYKAIQAAREALSTHPSSLARHVRPQDAVLLVVAHPDDECMFFAPTIRALRRLSIPVHVLCLSRGNYAGLGLQRKGEMEGSCRVLGVHCSVLDVVTLQDGPAPWPKEQVALALEHFMEQEERAFTILMTFDRWGVSLHPNHRDTHLGVRHFASTTQRGSFTLLELESVPLLAKYLGPLGIVYELVQARLAPRQPASMETPRVVALMPKGECYAFGMGAMRQHVSQLVWFRHLYLIFSRYLHLNTLHLRRPRS